MSKNSRRSSCQRASDGTDHTLRWRYRTRSGSANSTCHFQGRPHKAASPLGSFAKGIVQDLAGVHAALTQPWSNGQTEGQNTKLKLVKRQMYGRAKLDLLRACLLGPS